MRGRANRGQYSTRRHITLQTIENMLHVRVHALLSSSSMNRRTGTGQLQNTTHSQARAREQRLSLAATVEMVKQSSSVLISSSGLRRRQQLQERQHMLLSKLIHEIGGLHCMAAICTIHLIGNGYDDKHRHNTVIYSVCYWYATTARNTQSMTIIN